ncbi:SpoIIE family protein phosphatase [Bernardetia sp. ABR2-2B]|uniref:PP2C family protein-serine/threonine phosphatase n=1 Tax=Bernardetia sp. ABR2-2B TaxID=3127472 RepID=UPI0030CEE675
MPGAIVSVICNSGLNRSVREFGLIDTGEILDKTKELLLKEFEKSEEGISDGMDIALCKLQDNLLSYSGANNPLWIVRNGELLETKADKQPIGRYRRSKPFNTHTIRLEKGDTIYIFSDGYPDQFGVEKEKKYMTRKFKSFLISIQANSMEEQHKLLDEEFEKWKGKLDQIDDVCVIGVRV